MMQHLAPKSQPPRTLRQTGAALLAAMSMIMVVVHGLRLEAGPALTSLALFCLAATLVRGRSR